MADLSNSHPVLINKKHTKTTIRMMVSFHSLQAGPKRSFPEKKTENEHQQFQEKNMNPPKKKTEMSRSLFEILGISSLSPTQRRYQCPCHRPAPGRPPGASDGIPL
jgi:hypothetical protein